MYRVDKTMHETLTQLLMDNGAAVTKKSVDELLRFIAERDQMIVQQVIRDAEDMKRRLDIDTRTQIPINKGEQHQ